MKSIVLIVIVSLIATAQLVHSQDILEKHPGVLTYKQKIDSDTTLRSDTLENEEFLEHIDHGGILVGFYNDTLLVKVATTLYYSHGVEKVNYYVEGNAVASLVLREETFEMYPYNDETGEFEYSKAYISFHGQYVFNDGKLIDQISTGHNRFEDDTIDIGRTVRSELQYYLDMIIKKTHYNSTYKK